MHSWKRWAVVLPTLMLSSSQLYSRDVLLEAKGAYFLPTNEHFTTIFGGGGLYGGELTIQFANQSHWYGFVSVDYFGKSGCSECVPSPTSINLWIGAAGVKYFFPRVRDCVDFYLGLGVEPIYAKITNCSPFVQETQKQWTAGGIAKLGAYVRLPRNFILDFFVDYSAAQLRPTTDKHSTCCVEPVNFYIGGFAFGGGLGYCF